MSKARKINMKVIYIIAALALLVGMLPTTAVPVFGSSINMTLVSPIAPYGTSADSGYNVTDSTVEVSVTLTGGDTITSWSKTDQVIGTNSSWVGADPNTLVTIPTTVRVKGVWGETLIQATLSSGQTLTADKKWGQIASTSITPAGSGYVTWVEADKTFIGNTSVGDTVTGNFINKDGVISQNAVQGVILNWYLFSGNQTIDLSAGEYLDRVVNGVNVPGLQTRMAGYLPAVFARIGNSLPSQVTTTVNVTDGNGYASIPIITNGEESFYIVVVPEYPGDPQLPITPEMTSYNFKTREMEVVPQVRWAGEKIVLEKNFGTGYARQLVKFSLENQSPGALSAIGTTPGAGSYLNLTNTTQTVWTWVDPVTGLASCILESQDQGECDVTASLYGDENGQDMINQHGFVVYYLKLESLTLGNVYGKRAGHNTGDWTPANPWNIAGAHPDVTTDTLNVSADTLLRAQVKGWFYNSSNQTDRQTGSVDIGGSVNLSLPAGRWVLPDDWATLAGPNNWQERRIHWDIMSEPDNNAVTSAAALGPYMKGTKQVSGPNVVGPFSPGIELMTPTGWAISGSTGTWPDPARHYSTVVPDGNLNKWDAPMPPAKIIYEIISGNGYFKPADKTGIYYTGTGAAKVYTDPFYYELIPAHEAIPAFINNGGYDWNSFNLTQYGPYAFWKIINQPDGLVATSDPRYPTKVEVYTDNHGEAMVYLNGNWNLDLMDWLSNGAADIMYLTPVGNTTVTAWADYPYLRVNQPIYSNDVTKTWTWGGQVFGADVQHHPYPNYIAGHNTASTNRMVLTTGTYSLDANSPGFPNDVGYSNKKMAFLWVTDRDGMQAGVLGAKVDWTIGVTSGSTPIISGMNTSPGAGVDAYNVVTRNLGLTGGFLTNTMGVLTGSMDGHQGTSYLIAPSQSHIITTMDLAANDDTHYVGLTVLEALFYKFYNPQWYDPAHDNGLYPKNFAVAGIEVVQVGAASDFNILEQITSADFGMQPGMTGTTIFQTNASYAQADPIDDAARYGDANLDGKVNIGDVTKIERIILGLDGANVNADANGNGSIDMGDVVKTERMILGL